MPKKITNENLRKITLSLSVPFHVWQLAKEKGGNHIVELITLGKWAKECKINAESMKRLLDAYEEKIAKLQQVITDGKS